MLLLSSLSCGLRTYRSFVIIDGSPSKSSCFVLSHLFPHDDVLYFFFAMGTRFLEMTCNKVVDWRFQPSQTHSVGQNLPQVRMRSSAPECKTTLRSRPRWSPRFHWQASLMPFHPIPKHRWCCVHPNVFNQFFIALVRYALLDETP